MPEAIPAVRHRRPPVSEHLLLVGAAVACGLAGGLGAIFFRSLIHFFGELFLGSGSLAAALADGLEPALPEPLAPGADLPAWRRLLAPALGGALVGPLVYRFAREARGGGVAEVMEAVAVRGGMIRRRVATVKTLASALTIGSGGAVGREGPIVQIGAAIGSGIGQALRVPARQLRTLVGCGAAAGIAATFNAPIAGALFAVEVILAEFATAQLAPIVISSVVATVVSRAVLGDHPAFVAPAYGLEHPLELAGYAVLGGLSALVAVAFTNVLYATEDAFERVPLPEWAKPALGGAAVGAIGTVLPSVFGSGYGPISAALTGALPIATLALLVPAKLLATSITLGSGGSGGVFSPSLFLGAMTGGLFGSLLHGAFPGATAPSGAFALVAMGAVLAAATHSPITAIVMIFELTQSISIIPPLMVACVISTLAAGWLRRESIYTEKLMRRGLDLRAESDPNALRTLHVREVLDSEPERVPAATRFRDILDLVVRSRHSAFFVVDARGALLGAMSVSELRRLIFEEEALRHLVVAADLVEHGRPTVTEADDLDTTLHLMQQSDASELAVVAEDDRRRLVGAVHEHDVLEAYQREMLRRDLAGGITSRIALARRRQVDLGGGFVLAELDPPPALLGHTLRELDVRARTGVQVLLLRSRAGGRELVAVPSPDHRLAPGDVLVVAGPGDLAERLARAAE